MEVPELEPVDFPELDRMTLALAMLKDVYVLG